MTDPDDVSDLYQRAPQGMSFMRKMFVATTLGAIISGFAASYYILSRNPSSKFNQSEQRRESPLESQMHSGLQVRDVIGSAEADKFFDTQYGRAYVEIDGKPMEEYVRRPLSDNLK